MEKNIILSLFDESGGWSQPYRDAGYEVIQFDIQRDPSEDVYLQDWSQYAGKVYGVIAQPHVLNLLYLVQDGGLLNLLSCLRKL